MQFDSEKAQFTEQELEQAAAVARVAEAARNLKGPDGKLDATDFLKISGVIPDVIGLFEYFTEGAAGPEDDAHVAARAISVFAAYGRGSGLLEKLPGPGAPGA